MAVGAAVERPLGDRLSDSMQPLLDRPPRWLFHGLLAMAAVPMLWAASFPGARAGWLVLGLLVWCGFGVIWLVRVILYATHHRRLAWWFVVAPVMALVLVSLLAADVPVKARWAGSENAFEAAVAGIQADDNLSSGPQTLGSFRITHTERIPQGVIFFEADGAFPFDDAGFAYLPDGLSDDLATEDFEDPEFVSLGGHWYAWTASW